MNRLILGRAPNEKGSKLANELIIQNIKVSQAPIYLSLGPLNCNIFIRRTKMRIDDIMDLVKFVEATTLPEDTSFQRLLLSWRNTKGVTTAPIGSTMVGAPVILSVACVKSCFTDISISDTF